MRTFGVLLILIGAMGLALTSLLSLATGFVVAATGVAVSGAIFFAAGEIVAEMRLLAKWLNDEQQRRMEQTSIADSTEAPPLPRL